MEIKRAAKGLIPRGAILLLLAVLLLSGCDRRANPNEECVQAYLGAVAEQDRVMKIAFLQTWLADFPNARQDLRAKALREIWNIHAARNSLVAARAWASVELLEEASVAGRGMLYTLLFRDAVTSESKEMALLLAEEFWDKDLADPVALAFLSRSLILECGWNVELGTRLALRGAEITEPGRRKAEFLDLAGWGSFLLGRGEDSRSYLEAAVAQLPESDPSVSAHLANLYERLGDEEALLGVWSRLLERHMDLFVQARAESLHLRLGGDVAEFREDLWQRRLAGAKQAPDFELFDGEGRRHQLSSFRGRVVVLNFWHPMHDDCRKVLAALKVMKPPLSEVAILSVDASHRPQVARKIAAGLGVDWILLDDDQNISGQLFDVIEYPTTLFLDQKGRVVFRIEGFRVSDERRMGEILGVLIERGGS